jgi:hypothetical protein
MSIETESSVHIVLNDEGNVLTFALNAKFNMILNDNLSIQMLSLNITGRIRVISQKSITKTICLLSYNRFSA